MNLNSLICNSSSRGGKNHTKKFEISNARIHVCEQLIITKSASICVALFDFVIERNFMEGVTTEWRVVDFERVHTVSRRG